MSKIVAIGDIHGGCAPIKNLIQKIDNINTLILLGDVGANYYSDKRDNRFKKIINSFGFNIFCIRGNHEQRPSILMEQNPESWHMEKFWGNNVYVENEFPNIKYALDGVAVYKIPCPHDRNIILDTLVIPGAYSVDKYYRLTIGWNWFEKEQLSKEEMEAGEYLIGYRHFNLVLSHTCPSVYIPTDLFLPTIDQSTVDNTMENWLGKIEEKIRYDLWLFGHYHSNMIYPRYNDQQVIMLYENAAIDIWEYFLGGCIPSHSIYPLLNTTEITDLNN